MKKSLIFWMIIALGLLVLAITLLFNVFYFNNFRHNVRPLTETEKNEIKNILNQSVNNLGDYQIRFGNVYLTKNEELAQVELIKGISKIYYSIDLDRKKIIKR